MTTRALPAPASTSRPRAATASSRAARWRACALAAALALAAAYPSRAVVGQRSKVHVTWAESDGLVILNAYKLDDSGNPTGIAGLLIERRPDSTNTNLLHDIVQTFYATVPSDSVRRLLMEGDSALLHSVAVAVGGTVTNPPRFQRAEWRVLLGLLQARGGHDSANLVVDSIPEQYRTILRSELDSLFASRSPNPVFPYLRGVVLIDGNLREKTLEFSNPSVGDSASLTLRNIGMGPASFTLRIDPASTAVFRIVGNPSLTLKPNQDTTIWLRSLPSTVDSASATLLIEGAGTTISLARALLKARSSNDAPLPWMWIAAGVAALILILAVLAVATAPGRRLTVTLLTRTAARLHPPRPPDPNGDRVKLTLAVASTRELLNRLETVADTLETASQAQAKYDDLRASLTFLAREPAGTEDPTDEDALLGRVTTEISGLRKLETSLAEFFPAAGQADPALRSEVLVHAVRELRSDSQRLEGRVSSISTELETERTNRKQAETDRKAAREELDSVKEEHRKLEESLRVAEETREQIDTERKDLDSRLKQLQDDHAALEQRHQELDRYRIAFAEMIWLGPDAGYPEIQRRFSELTAGLKPAYLLKFEQLVVDLRAIFQRVKQQAKVEEIRNAANAILVGAVGTGGIELLLGKLQDPPKLLLLLGLERGSELWHLDRDAFYDRVVSREFKPILDDVARLSLYAGIRKPLDVARKLEEDGGIDARLLDRAFGLIELRLEEDFCVQLRTVKLFEEQFQDGKHKSAPYSVIERLLPFVKKAVTDLSQGTIYDITSVGYSSDRLNVQPCVSYKMR